MRQSAPVSSKLAAWLWKNAWLLALLVALGFLTWTTHVRIGRVTYLSDLACWSADAPEVDPLLSTGYARGQRRQLMAGVDDASYEWIMQTQQMLATGSWRIRQIDYDNAPHGRNTNFTAPYRGWLALLAWCDHLLSGRPLGIAVERAALYADPLLHALLVISVTAFAAHCFGSLAGALAAIASVGLFPLAGAFNPGAPDGRALAWVCALWSLLPWWRVLPVSVHISAGLKTNSSPARTGQFQRLVKAGIAGGLGVWVDAGSQWPIVGAIGIGAVCMQFVGQRDAETKGAVQLPWRAWSISGAAGCLLGYFFEFGLAPVAWDLRVVHPLHALAWLALGELVMWIQAATAARARAWRGTKIVLLALASVAVVMLPTTVMVITNTDGSADSPFATLLVNRSDGAMASNFGVWVARDGFSTTAGAVILPVVFAGLALWLALRRGTADTDRKWLALLLGPACVTLVLAWIRLRWWSTFDVAVLALLPGLTAAVAGGASAQHRRWWWSVAVVVILCPGFPQLIPGQGSRAGDPLDEHEVRAVLERDLAYWLVNQTPAGETPVILSTPQLTFALTYFGGVKGIGTFAVENEPGVAAATRIASASNDTEAQVLLSGREVTHVIVPSWDPMLEQYVRLGRRVPAGAKPPADALIMRMQNWQLPGWLRPIAYHIPRDPGFEELALGVFALAEETEEPIALCRRADYFVEMGLLDRAAAIREELRLHPRSLAALVSLAQIDQALGEAVSFSATLDLIIPQLARRSARTLSFDRRVNLAVVLTQAKQMEAARAQIELCLAEVDEARVRMLSTGATMRFLALCSLFRLDFPDPKLRELASSLLPPALRGRLSPNVVPRR